LVDLRKKIRIKDAKRKVIGKGSMKSKRNGSGKEAALKSELGLRSKTDSGGARWRPL
jgi:hypothetical protein